MGRGNQNDDEVALALVWKLVQDWHLESIDDAYALHALSRLAQGEDQQIRNAIAGIVPSETRPSMLLKKLRERFALTASSARPAGPGKPGAGDRSSGGTGR